jgi:hypothetical protein
LFHVACSMFKDARLQGYKVARFQGFRSTCNGVGRDEEWFNMQRVEVRCRVVQQVGLGEGSSLYRLEPCFGLG